MGDLQQRDARRVEFVGKRGITGRRKYADLLYCIPQRNRCRGCEITDSGGILRGVRKNLGAIVFDFSVFILASFDFVIIPFSPLNALIVTPANINSTIIVITNAISVIPLAFFFFVFIF